MNSPLDKVARDVPAAELQLKSEAYRKTATEQRLARFGCGCGCPTCRWAHSARRVDGRFTDCRGHDWEDLPF